MGRRSRRWSVLTEAYTYNRSVMNDKGKYLEYMFKDVELRVDKLINTFETKTLLMMQQACITLEAKTEADRMLVSSIEVKAIIMDDLRMIRKNIMTLKTAVKLKGELKFETFCLN